jgi:hypothetical protein
VNDSTPLADDPDRGLGQQFADLAHRFVRGDEVLDPALVVAMVVRAVPAADACGLSLLRPDRPPLTVAATDELPALVDRLQLQAQEGPLLEQRPGRGAVVVDDLLADGRWPRFSADCVEATGVRSLLSLRVALAGSDQAVLSLYGTTPGAFADGQVVLASMMAPFAALAVESRLRVEDVGNLTAALETSRQIGIAVGIVMASHRVPSDEAFALLRRSSMDLNRKLHDVAQEVELTGWVPGHETDAAPPCAPGTSG